MSENDKPEKYSLVDLDDPTYRLLTDLVSKHHTDIAEAEIALVYEHGIKKDCDGHLVWGRAKKVGPLEHQFREHDFTILLNAEVWATLPEKGKRALLDHELCHCGAKTNDAGDTTYYMRRHDLEEFVEIVRRHGLWKADLEAFVNASLGKEQTPLFPAPEEEAPRESELTEQVLAKAAKRSRKSAKTGA